MTGQSFGTTASFARDRTRPGTGDRLLDLDTLIAGLPARPDPAALVASFVPPPRFAGRDRLQSRIRRRL